MLRWLRWGLWAYAIPFVHKLGDFFEFLVGHGWPWGRLGDREGYGVVGISEDVGRKLPDGAIEEVERVFVFDPQALDECRRIFFGVGEYDAAGKEGGQYFIGVYFREVLDGECHRNFVRTQVLDGPGYLFVTFYDVVRFVANDIDGHLLVFGNGSAAFRCFSHEVQKEAAKELATLVA